MDWRYRRKTANSNKTKYVRKRLALGLSQVELAAKIGCSVSALRDWEHGKRTPMKFDRECLLQALNMEVKMPTIHYGHGNKRFAVQIRAVVNLTQEFSVDADDSGTAEKRALEYGRSLSLEEWGYAEPEGVCIETLVEEVK